MHTKVSTCVQTKFPVAPHWSTRDPGGGVRSRFKGLVHPKMKIKSLITHPPAVPTP